MKKLMNKFFLIAIGLIIASSFVTACGKKSDSNTIKVGVILPLTGTLAKFGEIEKNSFLLALDEINAAGGVKGKKIDLIIEDDDREA